MRKLSFHSLYYQNHQVMFLRFLTDRHNDAGERKQEKNPLLLDENHLHPQELRGQPNRSQRMLHRLYDSELHISEMDFALLPTL